LTPSPRCAVFISGRGSNLQVLLGLKNPNFQVDLVVSSSSGANGLKKAQEKGVETLVLSSPISWKALQTQLVEKKIEALFLAGFMKIIPKEFVVHWQGRIFNIHPSLLPKYKGLNAVRRAFAEKSSIGASIHRVVPDVDAGEVLKQVVSIPKEKLEDYNLEQVEQINLEAEHRLLQQWVEEQWPKVLTSSF